MEIQAPGLADQRVSPSENRARKAVYVHRPVADASAQAKNHSDYPNSDDDILDTPSAILSIRFRPGQYDIIIASNIVRATIEHREIDAAHERTSARRRAVLCRRGFHRGVIVDLAFRFRRRSASGYGAPAAAHCLARPLAPLLAELARRRRVRARWPDLGTAYRHGTWRRRRKAGANRCVFCRRADVPGATRTRARGIPEGSWRSSSREVAPHLLRRKCSKRTMVAGAGLGRNRSPSISFILACPSKPGEPAASPNITSRQMHS